MEDNKDKTVYNDDNEAVTSTQERTRKSMLAERPNIDVITARNEEEVKQDRKSTYKIVGIVALALVVIIIVIYFLTK